MQFFHQSVKRFGGKKPIRGGFGKDAERRATLDVARDGGGWYKVRAAVAFVDIGRSDRGVTKRVGVSNSCSKCFV